MPCRVPILGHCFLEPGIPPETSNAWWHWHTMPVCERCRHKPLTMRATWSMFCIQQGCLESWDQTLTPVYPVRHGVQDHSQSLRFNAASPVGFGPKHGTWYSFSFLLPLGNRNGCPVPVLPLYFGNMRCVWFQRLTGRNICLTMNCVLTLWNIWFRGKRAFRFLKWCLNKLKLLVGYFHGVKGFYNENDMNLGTHGWSAIECVFYKIEMASCDTNRDGIFKRSWVFLS